jgi:hypothetical protein
MLIARSTKKIVLLIFLSACGIISCTKNNNSSNGNGGASNDSTAAALSVSSASADNAYNDVLQVALETGFDNSIAYMVSNRGQGRVEENSVNTPATPLGLYTCANYTVSPNDTTTFPKTITIDFGVGCTSPDGIFRMGTITCVYSGKVLYPGTTVSVSFSNYSVNGYGLQGTYSIINNSSLAKGISFSTQVSNGNITFPDSTYYTYFGTKTVTQTAGESTPTDITDDVYSITGNNYFYSSASGNSILDSITTPLTKAEACGYISAGVISFVFNKTINGTLNFGNGTCDSLATINIGPFTDNIILQ